MGENSKIEWTHATFNPWWGCTKVSEACRNCYAEALDRRTGGAHWGPKSDRKFMSDKHWNEPRRWNAAAEREGVRRRVFCASMADAFEELTTEDGILMDQERERLWRLIDETAWLDWLLLTKRPENIARMVPAEWLKAPRPNVWLGTTVEDQEQAERRIPHLLQVPAVVHFLSMEPLLGPVDLSDALRCGGCGYTLADKRLMMDHRFCTRPTSTIDWVIVGGESGPGARPMHPTWARSIRDQCTAAGVPFFFKQWGDWAPHDPRPGGNLSEEARSGHVRIVHPSGRSDEDVFAAGGRNTEPGSRYMSRIGKKAAGRMLDGRTWDEVPGAM